jgi:hypothetical protein
MGGKVATRKGTAVVTAARSRAPAGDDALELKKPSARGYDEIVAATIASMRLDPVAFRRYLGENGARNMSLLLATARTAGL